MSEPCLVNIRAGGTIGCSLIGGISFTGDWQTSFGADMGYLLPVSSVLLLSLPDSGFADVLVLKDGTLVESDVHGLLTG